ncbi:MHYT domain signaling protein [Drechmeria coniospora]|uniref:MHYT domain signaling protein n=1 Tax=Drechmeria coniospora TaxID=98403 RepID=A0A151GP09_DRECN|nr:MHYT domain signaling protein [Drechmeria coniospora]KYK58808.1 MHYT domain signaling protein [Drechmeria coniospora]
MATTQELLEQYYGRVVPYSFNGGFVCLSYAISLIGTNTTLELIRRRTSHRGSHNFMLLIGAAIAMGGIAIWSMHFIGNRAIYMLDGQESFQISYSTSLTVLSLIVPILVLSLAFLGVSGTAGMRWWRIILAGLMSGGAICGMHYLADASISNYDSSYQISYVVGSALISVSASTLALALFFVFESTWNNVWWKRLGCAMVLAGAVSGMHWCAAVGTTYSLRSLQSPVKGVSRQEAMIVVICLSISAGVVMSISAMYSSWVRRDYASKSQQVVLAAAVFDEHGRIMVSQEGYLPSEVVTDTFVPKTNDDVFGTGHPLFHWMFRASRNWNAIAAVTDKMAEHIGHLTQDRNHNRREVRLVNENGLLVENYDTILQELFCLAAASLASKMKDSLLHVGVLWDEIFVTGDAAKRGANRAGDAMPTTPSPDGKPVSKDRSILQSLAEKGLSPAGAQEYGRGCLMFLVRQVGTKREMERLQASGYRFAELHQVAGVIRSSMQIKTTEMETSLRTMATHRESEAVLGRGLHLGLFAVRARLDRGGFDVLVRRAARNLLPSVPMPLDRLDAWQTRFLDALRGMTASSIMRRLENTDFSTPQERKFASELREAMASLGEFIDDAAFDEATLLPREVQVPCVGGADKARLSTCTLVALRLVLPIHATVRSPRCEFSPLSFFKVRQLVYEGSSRHLEFSHTVHRDMSSVMHGVPARPPSKRSPPARRPFTRALNTFGHALPGLLSPRASTRLPSTRSQEELSRAASSHGSDFQAADDASFEDGHKLRSMSVASTSEEDAKGSPQRRPNPLFGGIMVSQEVKVDVQEVSRFPDGHERRATPGAGALTTMTSQSSHQRTQSYCHLDGGERTGSEAPPQAESTAQVDNSYTATATGEHGTGGPGTQQESAFVDELLSLTVQADKGGIHLG